VTKIYVRIPRNRWTPIGEIDLDGYEAVYHGRKGGPIFPDEKLLSSIKKTTELTRRIREYEEKHRFSIWPANEFWGNRRDARKHDRHYRKLVRMWEMTHPYRLLTRRRVRPLPWGLAIPSSEK
jgi:hypothetical protein